MNVMTEEAFKLENQLCFRLYTASRLLTQAYHPLLSKYGLTYPQYLVLLVLWEKDAQPVNDIAKRLHLETNVSMYSYMQPILATVLSIILGVDALTWQKILATALVVGGVVLVSKSRAAARWMLLYQSDIGSSLHGERSSVYGRIGF